MFVSCHACLINSVFQLNGQPEANRAITSSSSQCSISARDGANPVRLELNQPHHEERDEQPESPTLWYGEIFVL